MMFFNTVKVPIDRTLYDRLVRIAKIAGYSNSKEFIVHVLEKEAGRMDQSQDDIEVEKQLRGLGYIE